MSVWELILGLAVPIASLVGIVVTAIYGRRTGKEANASNDWASLANAMGKWTDTRISERDAWTEKLLAERDARIERLETQNEETATKVANLECELSTTKDELQTTKDELSEAREDLTTTKNLVNVLTAKYTAAISYIKLLIAELQNHIRPEDMKSPPEEIKLDLDA